MQIEIDIPHPLPTLVIITSAVIAYGLTVNGLPVFLVDSTRSLAGDAVADSRERKDASLDNAMLDDGDIAFAMAEDGPAFAASVIRTKGGDAQAEDAVRLARTQRDLVAKRVDFLRMQLAALQREREALGDDVTSAMEEEIRASAQRLMDLMRSQREAEQFLKQSLTQYWGAQGRARAIARARPSGPGPIRIAWPVDPDGGISAEFHDTGYRERFGFAHEAIDIRVLQGTSVRAAAYGIVAEVEDNGYGFNSITIEHDEGFVTLYGHLTEFHVEEGQRISAGEVIGRSGGMPGTRGAGLSTGPHLHFAVLVDGEAVDPEDYLPKDIAYPSVIPAI